jgi:hypothetical protein
VRGCRVHRLIARRARRLGSRQTSHLVDVERRRCCKDSVHSSGSFCTKLRLLALRTPPSWLAAGAPGRMPAVRGPDMHHASLCAGAYPKGLREANGLASGSCGEEASAGFLLRGKQDRIQWSIFPLTRARGHPFTSATILDLHVCIRLKIKQGKLQGKPVCGAAVCDESRPAALAVPVRGPKRETADRRALRQNPTNAYESPRAQR